MILSDKIKKIQGLSDFVFWTAAVGENKICELTRVSGFIIEDNNEHITFFLPLQLFKIIEPTLKKNSNMSFLMVSVETFESYQIKGNYVSHKPCTDEDVDLYRIKIMRVIDIISGMGLSGNNLFGYLLEQPSIAITMHCLEMYEQTPKPGTGCKIID